MGLSGVRRPGPGGAPRDGWLVSSAWAGHTKPGIVALGGAGLHQRLVGELVRWSRKSQAICPCTTMAEPSGTGSARRLRPRRRLAPARRRVSCTSESVGSPTFLVVVVGAGLQHMGEGGPLDGLHGRVATDTGHRVSAPASQTPGPVGEQAADLVVGRLLAPVARGPHRSTTGSRRPRSRAGGRRRSGTAGSPPRARSRGGWSTGAVDSAARGEGSGPAWGSFPSVEVVADARRLWSVSMEGLGGGP